MFDMKVEGLIERGVSTTYTITVGKDEAINSVMIVPLADHVKASICPGVSKMMYLRSNINLTHNLYNHNVLYTLSCLHASLQTP